MAKGFLEDTKTDGFIPVDVTVSKDKDVIRIRMSSKGISTALVISEAEFENALNNNDGR